MPASSFSGADKFIGETRFQTSNPNFRSTEDKDYQHDSLNNDPIRQQIQQQTSSLRRSSNGNHVYGLYDYFSLILVQALFFIYFKNNSD